jgi:urease accessory protein
VPSHELILMLLGDARLPVGGHVHSGGLEPALLGGLAPDQIPGYLQTRLRTTTRIDAAVAVLAHRAIHGGTPLATLAAAWCARTPSPVARQAALALGRGVQRLLDRLWGTDPAATALSHLAEPYRPLAVGALGVAAGLDPHETALLICHDDVQSITSAALKLAPMDPAEATAWALTAHPTMTAVAAEAALIDTTDDLPALSAPLAECWVQWHADHERRLFLA